MIHIAIEAHGLDEEFEQELAKFDVTVADRKDEPWCVIFAGERHNLIKLVREHWYCENVDDAEDLVRRCSIRWPPTPTGATN
jgi:hypothetical protein